MTLPDMTPALAIIPARGGSKGIPRKNVLPVAGKPLIVWTIEAARAAATVGRVVVTTDDAEIAAVAAAHGAGVVHRPAELSGDTATSEAALLHALEHLDATEGFDPAVTVFLQCTSPLMTADDIDGTVNALLLHGADSALAVAPFHHFLWDATGAAAAAGINHDKRVRPRRQDREPQYVETGAVYAMRTAGFRRARHRFFGKTVTHVTPAERCLEIDESVDLEAASLRLRGRVADVLPEPVGAVVFDFDGVLTDNGVTVAEDGTESVRCDRSDGLGLARLREAGLPMLVLSTERNPVVAARCRKLRLECLQGIADKRTALLTWLDGKGIDPVHAVYVGNDTNDLGCLRSVGCGVVVADAHPDVRGAARLVLSRAGGHGAVRELCDRVAAALDVPLLEIVPPPPPVARAG